MPKVKKVNTVNGKTNNKTRATSKKVALVPLSTLKYFTIRNPWESIERHKDLPDGADGGISSVYADGKILLFSTSCHGGFFVVPELNKKIPAKLRITPGWYEEDSDWASVVVTFPQYFPKDMVKAARVNMGLGI